MVAYLLAVGADTVGDVRVLPPGVVPDNEYAEPITEFDPTQLARRFHLLIFSLPRDYWTTLPFWEFRIKCRARC